MGRKDWRVGIGIGAYLGNSTHNNINSPNKQALYIKFGVGRSKLGVPGHIHPEIKGQWLNWIFFLTFEVAKLDFFFVLSCQMDAPYCIVNV